jgi:large subunit ribosomal protein L21
MATKASTAEKAPKAAKAPKVADAAKEFSVIQTGGKQYLVSQGDTVKIEKMKGDFKVGDSVVFSDVLLHDDGSNTTIGTPFITGAKVTAEVKKIAKAKKVVVIKYKAKSNYFKKRGHRQPFFEVQITKLG